MYNIYNYSNVYYLWDNFKQTEYLIGNKKDLINEMAKNFRIKIWLMRECGDSKERPHYSNNWLDEYYYIDYTPYKRYVIYDGYCRLIDIKEYDDVAFRLYLSNYKDRVKRFYFRKSKIKYGHFRYDPVPYTGSRGGGSSIRPRKIKHLKQMYANPEYKQFNRGSHKDVPDGWWDDWYRNVERSWKKHRKHQWKEKVSVM